jgi:hypothetical protein
MLCEARALVAVSMFIQVFSGTPTSGCDGYHWLAVSAVTTHMA